jgi:hypothetical protein
MSSPYDNDEILQQRLDEIVEDIFSSTEFINFIDSFRIDRNPDAEPEENNDDYDYEYYYPESLNVTNFFHISSLSAGIIDETLNNYIQNSTTTTFLPSTTTLHTDTIVTPYIDSFSYEKVNEKIEECSICLVDFQNEDDVALLNCNHLFHKACIDEWCARKPDCPNCREKI